MSQNSDHLQRILLIENDGVTAALLLHRIDDHGCNVTVTPDAEHALALLDDQDFHLLIYDFAEPLLIGLDQLTRIQNRKPGMPVLVLSSLTDAGTRADILDVGADDVLTKPFEFNELYARIHALIRRSEQRFPWILHADDLTYDCVRHEVARGASRVHLRPKEAEILELLLRHQNRILSRSEILKFVWGLPFDPGTNLIDVYICYLRHAIDRDAVRPLIHTVRGQGFVLLNPPPQRRDLHTTA